LRVAPHSSLLPCHIRDAAIGASSIGRRGLDRCRWSPKASRVLTACCLILCAPGRSAQCHRGASLFPDTAKLGSFCRAHQQGLPGGSRRNPLPPDKSLIFHRLLPRPYGPGLAPGVATRFRPRGFRCRPSRPILPSPSPRSHARPARKPALSRQVRRAPLRRSSVRATGRKRLPSRANPRGPGQQARAPRRQRPQTISRPRRRAPSHRRRPVRDRPVVQARTHPCPPVPIHCRAPPRTGPARRQQRPQCRR
jgi:hypothetical protein